MNGNNVVQKKTSIQHYSGKSQRLETASKSPLARKDKTGSSDRIGIKNYLAFGAGHDSSWTESG